ncbi:hypothetical protein NHP164001_15930 [Helicobacter trogontum]|uniref:EexN family lipoprotein n=1 Tax=Helicobacter trogontum TaxID=50960 RepID=A0ABQ0D5H6_9HELI
MKINMLKGIMLGAVACIIIGCGESEKSAEYYLNHDKEREEKVKECKEKGGIDSSINCKHAGKAAYQKILENTKAGF